MKNNIIKGLIVATIIAITSVTIQNSYAYNLDKSYKEALVRDSGNANYTVKNMAPILGEKELTDLTTMDIQLFVTDLLNNGNTRTHSGLAANSVNGIISVIQSFTFHSYLATLLALTPV